MSAHFLGKMVEMASSKQKIIQFHIDSTPQCGLVRKSVSKQFLRERFSEKMYG
jgi:hypothetical protein